MPMNKLCLNDGNGTLTISEQALPLFDGSILPVWARMAQSKGFSIVARVCDRFHLLLRCDVCSGLTRTKLFVLMNNQLICAPCLAAKQAATAKAAGVTLLQRDPADRHYAYYSANCGHKLRRQFAKIEQVAQGGKALRCAVCLHDKHAAEAGAQGWTLLGPDPKGRVSYRLYHHNSCGAEQSVTIGNMNTGRFDCAGCGETWSAAPSYVYLMRFHLDDGSMVFKLGYSRNPASRLNHQLQSGLERTGELMQVVPLPTGHLALCEEKAMHGRLQVDLPGAIVLRPRFAGQIKVRSEIYTPDALPMITSLLDDLKARLAA